MPEIRAAVPVDIHRKLKAEAAREGVHLKALIAKILENHITNGKGGAPKKKLK